MHLCFHVLLGQVDTTPQRPMGKLFFYHIPFHFCRVFFPYEGGGGKDNTNSI